MSAFFISGSVPMTKAKQGVVLRFGVVSERVVAYQKGVNRKCSLVQRQECSVIERAIFERALNFWPRNFFLNFSTPCI